MNHPAPPATGRQRRKWSEVRREQCGPDIEPRGFQARGPVSRDEWNVANSSDASGAFEKRERILQVHCQREKGRGRDRTDNFTQLGNSRDHTALCRIHTSSRELLVERDWVRYHGIGARQNFILEHDMTFRISW